MKKFLYMLSVLLVGCYLVSVIAGCTAQKKTLPPGPDPVPPDKVPRMNVKPSPQKSSNIGADLNKTAETVKGVKKAYTVVFGNVAMVGVDIDKALDSDRTSILEKQVKSKIERDSRIVKAYITTESDITARIKKVASEVEKGQPLSNYLDEIKDIIKQIK